MRHRVQDILLVSSLYDSFILAEDGQLHELILSEFLDLNLRHTPGSRTCRRREAALALATDAPLQPDHRVGQRRRHERRLARARLREAGVDTPVVVLAYDSRELRAVRRRARDAAIDRVFLWQGDARILLAIVKYVEDRRNVAHDTGESACRRSS